MSSPVGAGETGQSRLPDHRIIRRLRIDAGPTGVGDDAVGLVGVVVDVETTGTDVEQDAIIQLALRRFRYDRDGHITRIDRSYSWLEDPGRPIPPEVQRLTGITDDMVRGRVLKQASIEFALTHCELVIAHHAAFDRKFVDRRLPDIGQVPWACSMEDVDWLARGFDGRKLGFLGVQCGWFFEAHRADADVDAVIGLLRHQFADGTTALSELVATSGLDTWLVRAWNAPFERKAELRRRGYRWDVGRRVWAREIPDACREPEERWLAETIYSTGRGSLAGSAGFERIDRWSRYS